MRDWTQLKQRYQADQPAVQLGGLASNLSRLRWYAERSSQQDAALVFRESKYFTEWAAPFCSVEQQGLLAQLQLQLAIWERGWGTWVSPASIAHEAQAWSARLLEASGLPSSSS